MERVGGWYETHYELSGFPPYYSLILLPYNTQCACERACHGSTLGCPEWVCMDDIAKNGCCQKRKKAGVVGWSARVWQQEGGPRAQEEVRWVADRSLTRMNGVVPELKKDVKSLVPEYYP